MASLFKQISEDIQTFYMRRYFIKRDAWMSKSCNLPHLTKEEVRTVNEVWPFVHVTERDLIWLRMFKKEYGFDPYFITDYQLLYILRYTNPYKHVISLENKAMLDVYFPDISFPHNYVKSIKGVLYINGKVVSNQEAITFLSGIQDAEVVIKPTINTGCGRGVQIISIKDVNLHEERYGEDFVIQEVLQQHPLVAALNPTSVNSCRVTTIYLDGVFSYSAILKIGKKESRVDNWNSSYLVGVSPDGEVFSRGFDNRINPVIKSDNGIAFGNMKLPCFSDMINSLKQWHIHYFPQVGIVGWDVLVDQYEKVRVIEINLNSPGVVGEQFCSGTFFKEHREEIIKHI